MICLIRILRSFFLEKFAFLRTFVLKIRFQVFSDIFRNIFLYADNALKNLCVCNFEKCIVKILKYYFLKQKTNKLFFLIAYNQAS